MGVMRCDVSTCENIMCDRLHNKHGYICNRCFDRLVNLGVRTNLKEFFETPIEEEVVDKDASYAYFDKLMPMPNREYI